MVTVSGWVSDAIEFFVDKVSLTKVLSVLTVKMKKVVTRIGMVVPNSIFVRAHY